MRSCETSCAKIPPATRGPASERLSSAVPVCRRRTQEDKTRSKTVRRGMAGGAGLVGLLNVRRMVQGHQLAQKDLCPSPRPPPTGQISNRGCGLGQFQGAFEPFDSFLRQILQHKSSSWLISEFHGQKRPFSMGGALGKQNKRLPRYLDVENDHIRPANHTPLAEDPIGQGQFVKMGKRPLMSLVAGGALPPRTLQSEPPACRPCPVCCGSTTFPTVTSARNRFFFDVMQPPLRHRPLLFATYGAATCILTCRLTQGRRGTTPGCPAGCAQMASTTNRTSPPVAGHIRTTQAGLKRGRKTRGGRT